MHHVYGLRGGFIPFLSFYRCHRLLKKEGHCRDRGSDPCGFIRTTNAGTQLIGAHSRSQIYIPKWIVYDGFEDFETDIIPKDPEATLKPLSLQASFQKRRLDGARLFVANLAQAVP